MRPGVESISVAIQGVRGAFHAIAAGSILPNYELLRKGLWIVGEFRQGAMPCATVQN